MATAPNPFQQFISGLFGGMKTSTPSSSSSYAGPYSSSYYASQSATAAKPAPAKASTFNPKTDPRVGATASWISPTDAAADRAGMPFIPGGAKGGGMTLVPDRTDARTGLPASSNPRAVNPTRPTATNQAYTPITRTSATTTGSSSTSRGSTSVGTASVSAAPAAPAAPPQAPASSAGSYSSPSGYSGGGSTPMAGPSVGSDYRSKYLEMLSGLYDPDKLEDSQTALDKIRRRAADTQLMERREERRIKKNEVGQGLRSYNDQLSDNSRLASAELADLAIAASPFEQYIETARSAAKDIYGVGRDMTSDSRAAASDALAERKFQEDVRQFGLRYALDQQQENRLSSTASKPSVQETIAAYVQAFTPGTEEYRVAQQNLGGVPPVDENGFITPEGFKAAAQEAAASGITRKQFLELFGSQLYADSNGNVDPKYGLTAVEKKLIQGTVE